MPVKGDIPVVDEQYDLTSVEGAVNTGQNVVAGAVGVGMAIGIFAAGRAMYNKVQESTDSVQQVEVF